MFLEIFDIYFSFFLKGLKIIKLFYFFLIKNYEIRKAKQSTLGKVNPFKSGRQSGLAFILQLLSKCIRLFPILRHSRTTILKNPKPNLIFQIDVSLFINIADPIQVCTLHTEHIYYID